MEIRKQILGIAIGFFITISFITPVYSYYSSYDDVCDLQAIDLRNIVREALENCYVSGDQYDKYITC